MEEGRIFRLLKRAVCSQQNNAQPGAATLQLSISVFDKQQNPAQPSKIPSLCHPEIKATRHLPHQKTGILPAQPTAPGWHFSSLNTKQAENLKKTAHKLHGFENTSSPGNKLSTHIRSTSPLVCGEYWNSKNPTKIIQQISPNLYPTLELIIKKKA